MAKSLQNLLKHQHVLLIQGKMGNFFSRFASFLQKKGIKVSKINLNAGDAFFYRNIGDIYNYKDSLEYFDIFLSQLIQSKQIDAIVCFGDCRPHHAIASMICKQLEVGFFVFEEGYLRPDYITLQQDGINGNSQLNVDEICHLQKANDKPLFTDNRFYRLCFAAIAYYIMVWWRQKEFPNYHHYRGMDNWQEAMTWLRAPFIKAKGYLKDKDLEKKCKTALSNRYFLVSLQVYNDSQITFHSDYRDIIDFIDEVLTSFAKFANKDHHLVLKHHPLDRAHRQYGALIEQLASNLGIANRVHYGCDMHLPSLIRHSLGMITVNSTTGLQSVYHDKPTKVMGRAIYDLPKLTHQPSLATFWQFPQKPKNEFYCQFREYLIEQTQLNGSFYGKSPWRDEPRFIKRGGVAVV
ncbi:capsular polysaccharide biosynthesis protein [Moraxella macacae 0408225]|uniref:Capsular polysaccharide biosynthesis protein n=1 Tax=Moraxella macacae 0408225 TaxID=1230338 RepID=L2F9I2_9GAMM|nr:capsular biosynthesis protein [Moraxella macacae]ELA09697.1 capsular polysaccharide biosynthesis protein [Moraxella macacae 0408225]